MIWIQAELVLGRCRYRGPPRSLGPASAVLVLGGGGGLGVGGRGQGAGQLRPRGQGQQLSPPAHGEWLESVEYICSFYVLMYPVHFTAHMVWTIDYRYNTFTAGESFMICTLCYYCHCILYGGWDTARAVVVLQMLISINVIVTIAGGGSSSAHLRTENG